ncbi:MAG: UDP-3-O-acyl-N-acetylglucosamine deacetylase [Pseudomonadota bacterium]|jgi:UDP-3-O-[3-hydroxymyristoyl] N-acetylglucosamine deacetylase
MTAPTPPTSSLPDPLVLVVDDEASIRRSLEGILRDEGMAVIEAADGASAIAMLIQHKPALVLLDIWMPGIDGLETLKKIKEISPGTPVVMISGHATISTAVAATRLGAADFLEKPLGLASTIQVVRRVLEQSHTTAAASNPTWETIEPSTVGPLRQSLTLNPIVFAGQKLRGASRPQRTIAHAAILYGQGLHSGRKSGLILEPLPANSGIHFVGVSETTTVPAHVDFVESTGFATTVRLGQTQAGTIEHLMSALCAYGVSNLLIKCNSEVPVMDGSALEFCKLFDNVGLTEQDGAWYEIAIDAPIHIGNGKEWIKIEPADSFSIDYTLRYPEPVGEQHFTFTLRDPDSYRTEIAPSRTFSFVKDVGHLQKQGLALGGRFDNFLLIGTEGAINDAWRFPNEPVRHKILDAIGDLFLLGRPLRGKVTACMTGHSDNIALLKQLRQAL